MLCGHPAYIASDPDAVAMRRKRLPIGIAVLHSAERHLRSELDRARRVLGEIVPNRQHLTLSCGIEAEPRIPSVLTVDVRSADESRLLVDASENPNGNDKYAADVPNGLSNVISF